MKFLPKKVSIITPLTTAGMIADYIYDIEWAASLSLFALWAVIALSFLTLFADSGEIFKEKENRINLFLNSCCLITQAAVGWTVTAVFFAIAWFCVAVKRAIYEGEQ